MTVSNTSLETTYNGNGSTTEFNVPFRFLDDDDVVVVQIVTASGSRTTLEKGTHYEVTGAGTSAGGTVTMLTAPPTGYKLEISRDMDITQPYDPRSQGAFSTLSLASALDRQAMIAQQLDARVTNELAAVTASLLSAIDELGDGEASTNPVALNLADYGLGASGTSADAALALAATAINALGGGATLYFPSGTWTMSATVALTSLQGCVLRGAGRNSTNLEWAGAAGIPMFRFTNSQHCVVQDMTLIGDAANPPSAAIEFYFNSVPSYVYVSTVNTLANLRIGTGEAAAFTFGVRVYNNPAGSDVNNDEFLYINVRIRGTITACVSIEQSQAKDHFFISPQFQESARGITTALGTGAMAGYGGNFIVWGGLIQTMTVAAFEAGLPTTDSISLIGVDSEACATFFKEGTSGRFMRAVTILGCRVKYTAALMDSDESILRLGQAGPYKIEGNYLGGDAPMKILLSSNTGPNHSASIRNNVFGGYTASEGAAEVSPIVVQAGSHWGDVILEGNAYATRTGVFGKRAETIDSGPVYNQGLTLHNSGPRGCVLRFDYTAFKYTTATGSTGVAALTKDLLAMVFSARTRIKSMYARVSTAFAGCATLAFIVGNASAGNQYLTTFDAKATGYYGLTSGHGTLLTGATYVLGSYVPSMTATSDLYLRLTATTDNLESLTAGVMYLHIECDRPGSDAGTT